MLPGGVSTVGRILVGVRDAQHVEKMADFVDLIDRERIIHIKLLHVAPESGPASGSAGTVTGRDALDLMKAELTDRGVNPAAIDVQINVSDDPEHELVTVARNDDLTVPGTTEEPDLRDRVFGPVSNYIISRANSTVLTIS